MRCERGGDSLRRSLTVAELPDGIGGRVQGVIFEALVVEEDVFAAAHFGDREVVDLARRRNSRQHFLMFTQMLHVSRSPVNPGSGDVSLRGRSTDEPHFHIHRCYFTTRKVTSAI